MLADYERHTATQLRQDLNMVKAQRDAWRDDFRRALDLLYKCRLQLLLWKEMNEPGEMGYDASLDEAWSELERFLSDHPCGHHLTTRATESPQPYVWTACTICGEEFGAPPVVVEDVPDDHPALGEEWLIEMGQRLLDEKMEAMGD